MKTIFSILLAVLFLHGSTVSALSDERASTQNKIAVKKIAEDFARSGILGTGGRQYLTSVSVHSNEKAIAIIGEEDDSGTNRAAYQANFKKIKGQWKIISIEFVFQPTGKKKVEAVTPPFPDPYWEKNQ